MKILNATATALLLASTSAIAAQAGEYKDGMKKAKMTASMEADADYFDDMDVDVNGEVDFTEFSNYLEANHGWTAGDSAKEYVRLTSGTNGVITDRSFAGLDIRKLPHTHMDGTQHAGTMQKGTMTESASMIDVNQPTAVMSRTITASPVTGDAMMRPNYGAFADYDVDRDGRVVFSEYSTYRSKAGIRTTQAAQEFIRFSDGRDYFDETRFAIAATDDVLAYPYARSSVANSTLSVEPGSVSGETLIAVDAVEYDVEYDID